MSGIIGVIAHVQDFYLNFFLFRLGFCLSARYGSVSSQ